MWPQKHNNKYNNIYLGKYAAALLSCSTMIDTTAITRSRGNTIKEGPAQIVTNADMQNLIELGLE